MKVDVITRHAVANYGSIIQAYATQKVIEDLGYECDIINYVREDEKDRNISKTLLKNSAKWNKNFVTRMIFKIIQDPNYYISYKKFCKFRKKLLKETIEYNTIEQLKNNLPDADIFCTGSDQVWGPIGTSEYDEAYFLKFVPNDKKTIAYSSSFGKKDNNKSVIGNLKYLLSDYSKLLVREDTAVDIIKNAGFENVEQVVDPVLLLKDVDFDKIIEEPKIKEDYILVYQLHDNKKFEKYTQKIAKEKNMKLIRVSPSLTNFFKCGKTVYLPTPREFLGYIKNAKFIITDSFHGTAFSLIFNKKFVDIPPQNGITRIESVLRVFGLENRLVKNYDEYDILDKDIDYDRVNAIIDAQRLSSLQKLKDALKN